jgi:Tfp pilus assembly protein PilW
MSERRGIVVKSRTAGITLVELLVALAIGGLLLGLLGAYFSQQTRTSSKIQARHDVANKVRAAAELISQDLQVAGSQAIAVDDGGAKYIDLPGGACNSQERKGCVATEHDADLNLTTTRIVYATSLVPAEPCRQVDYIFDHDAEVLYRRDESCVNPSSTDLAEHVLAEGITDFEITYRCAALEGAASALEFHTPAECYENETVVVEALISISGTVEARGEEFSSVFETSALTPNLRRFDLY